MASALSSPLIFILTFSILVLLYLSVSRSYSPETAQLVCRLACELSLLAVVCFGVATGVLWCAYEVSLLLPSATATAQGSLCHPLEMWRHRS